MEGQRHKKTLEVVSSGLQKCLNLMNISLRPILKNAMKETLLQLMFNIVKIYRTFAIIYHFCLKELKLTKFKKLYQTCMRKKNYIMNSFGKTSIKSLERKKQTNKKMNLKNISWSWWMMQFLETRLGIREKIEISNL